MKKRPRRLRHHRPPLTVDQVLAWADHEFEKTGRWPDCKDGEALADPTEKWVNLDAALRSGGRGLPKGSSLARLLAERRGVRNHRGLPPLTENQLASWAEAHFQRTGEWPRYETAGPVAEAPEENWFAINSALQQGLRGLPGGDTLARFLARRFGIRNQVSVPCLTVEQVLAWADAHHKRTGQWPRVLSGPIEDAPGETWLAVNSALLEGLRGLPGGSSLAKVLTEHRGVRNKMALPPLTRKQILAWADAHRRRTGMWPGQTSGPVAEAPGETWLGVHNALYEGLRGLPGGDSLHQLLVRNRRKRG